MGDDDREHRAKLRKEYTRRKRLLEIRKARQGDAADPALDIDLEEVNASLALLDLADAPRATAEVKAAAGVGLESIVDLAIAQLGKFGERLTNVEAQGRAMVDRVIHIEENQQAAAQWREDTGQTIDGLMVGQASLVARQANEVESRRRGQRRNFVMLAAVLVLLVVYGAGRLAGWF